MSGTIELSHEDQVTLRNASDLRSSGFPEAAKHLEASVWDRHLPRQRDADDSMAPFDWNLWQEWLNQRQRQKGWNV